MFSLRTQAVECLRLTGTISAKKEILSIPNPPTLSMKEALEFIHQHRCRPRSPSFLQLTEPPQPSGTLSLSWRDNSDNESGFRLRFRGRLAGSADHEDAKTVAASASDVQHTTLSGLRQGFEYRLDVLAFNEAGESKPSEAIVRTIPVIGDGGDGEPEPAEETRQVDLQRQPVTIGAIPYLGTFPPGGVVPRGRLLKIHFPSVGAQDRTLRFPKEGKSTASCGVPSDVTVLEEGGDLTGDDLKSIFGANEPEFSILSPLRFVACLSTPGVAPSFVTVRITVRFT